VTDAGLRGGADGTSTGGTAPAGASAVGVVVDLTVDPDDPVDGERWAALLAAALRTEGVAPGASVGLAFVDVASMAGLNAEHMGGDGPTDVLAFPIDGLEAEGPTAGRPAGIVGDVVVCPAVAAANAPGHAGSVEDEIALLVVHGALHLIGHDHADPVEREAMRVRERALLAAHHGALAGDPWADPAEPADPAVPTDPADPTDPAGPAVPSDPVEPAEPVVPVVRDASAGEV